MRGRLLRVTVLVALTIGAGLFDGYQRGTAWGVAGAASLLVAGAGVQAVGLRHGSSRRVFRFACQTIFISALYWPLTLGLWPHDPVGASVVQCALFGLGMAGWEWWRTSSRRNSTDHYVTNG
jgi:hypothetical protein